MFRMKILFFTSEKIALETITEDVDKDFEKDIMTIVAEDGSEEEVEVILAFEFKDNKKEYIVYTRDEKGEDGESTLYVSSIDRSEGEPKLQGVDDEKEWERIKDVLWKLSEDDDEDYGQFRPLSGVDEDGIEVL